MTRKFVVKPYFKVPKLLRKTPRLTIRDMADKTPQKTRSNARKVVILRVVRKTPPRFLYGWSVYKVYTMNTANRHEYIVTVFAPQDRVYASDKVIIDSECPLHVFTYEVALAKRGNSFVYRSNGDAPISTNPRMRPGVDHHVLATFRHLLLLTKKYKRLSPTEVREMHTR